MRDLSEIERGAQAATPGPWQRQHFPSGTVCVQMPIPDDRHCVLDQQTGTVTVYGGGYAGRLQGIPERQLQDERMADAAFIANARTDVPDLCAEVRRLRAAVEKRSKELLKAMQERDEARANCVQKSRLLSEAIDLLYAATAEMEDSPIISDVVDDIAEFMAKLDA